MGGIKDLLGDTPYVPREAFARSGDPSTSHAAARRIEKKLTGLQQAVFEAIQRAGDYGATWNEIARDTGIDKASVSPRFKPLREAGLIKMKVYSNGDRVTRDHQTVWVVV